MSKPEDDAGTVSDEEAFARLESAVQAASARIQELRTDLKASRAQGREMEDLLRKFTGGEEDPSVLLARLGRLERENKDLLDRLARGKEGVERLLARIRFLEEQG